MRLGRRRLLARYVGLRNGAFFDRPHGLARHAIEDVQPRLLARYSDRFDRPAGHGDVRENRCRGHVKVPDRMVHELEMPLPLAGLQIDADKTLGIEVVARAVTAVVVGRRRFDRQVDETEFLVDADLSPHTDVASALPRVVLPGSAAGIQRRWDGVELPELFPCAYIKRPHEAFRVVVRGDGRAFPERGSDDDHITGDGWRGMHADFTALEIDLLVDAAHDTDLQIDRAVVAERGEKRPRLRVQLDEAVAGRNEYDAVVAPAIAPVRKAAPRQLPWRKPGSLALTKTLRPNQLTRLRVQGHDGAARASRRVQHASHHQRCSLQFVFRERAEGIGLEPPRDLEPREVRGVDLAERRIPGSSPVDVVVRPVPRHF